MFYKEEQKSNEIQKAKRAKLKSPMKWKGNPSPWHNCVVVKSNSNSYARKLVQICTTVRLVRGCPCIEARSCIFLVFAIFK